MSEDSMKQNQDRRLKPTQGDDNTNNLQNQPQKCPRCESLNTKFCYYNNYSLSQPRYFCKTCRRYWTQGGTLRNVPVGGGCRKGKRAKTSSSSSAAATPSSTENSRPQVSQPLSLATSQNLISDTTSPSIGSFYSGGGFLNSLAAIQSLNAPPQSFALDHHYQPVNLAGDSGISTSNLNLLHGFNAMSPFGSQNQRQIYANQHPDWQETSFMSNTNPTVSDTSLWSISTATAAATTSSGSFPLNPTDHQWHDLPGYGPPP